MLDTTIDSDCKIISTSHCHPRLFAGKPGIIESSIALIPKPSIARLIPIYDRFAGNEYEKTLICAISNRRIAREVKKTAARISFWVNTVVV